MDSIKARVGDAVGALAYWRLPLCHRENKMRPEKPDLILLADIFLQIARLGAIHPVLQPSASS